MSSVRVSRQAVDEARRILQTEGCLVVESQPKAGLTVFLAQLRDGCAAAGSVESHYINCALPGVSLRQALAQQLNLRVPTYPGLLAAMKGERRLLLLVDRPDLAPPDEYRELLAFLHTLSSERLFSPELAASWLVLGICGRSNFHAACSLNYFTREEVAALPGCDNPDTAAQVHYWSSGSPAVATEICRHLPGALHESADKSVYKAVLATGTSGRLGYLAGQDLTLHELTRIGLAVPDSTGEVTPLPAYIALRAGALERCGHLVINRGTGEVRYKGRLLPLFPRESRILRLLAERPGQVFSPAQIYRYISADSIAFPGEESVKTHLSRLRRKLPPGVEWIVTRRGLGYSFSPLAPLRLIDEA